MRKWISFPRVEGKSSRQAHTDLPDGSYERELGKDGFLGPSTQMYHQHPPTAWSHIEGPLNHRLFDTGLNTETHASPWQATTMLSNNQVSIKF